MLTLLFLAALESLSPVSRADLVLTQTSRDAGGGTTRATIIEEDAEGLYKALGLPESPNAKDTEKNFVTRDGHVRLKCVRTPHPEYRCELAIVSVIKNDSTEIGDTAVLALDDSTSATNLSDNARTLYASLALPVQPRKATNAADSRIDEKRFETRDGMAAISCSEGSCLFIIHLKSETAMKPLIGSIWAAKNPGKLPYETCSIVSLAKGDGEKNLSTDIGGAFIAGGGRLSKDVRPALLCTSEKLGLEFALPLTIDNIHRIGLDFDVGAVYGDTSMTVTKLQGKSLTDLFGKFRGVEAGIGFVMSSGGFVARNRAGMVIRDRHRDTRVGLDLGYIGFRISRRALTPEDEVRPALVLPEQALQYRFLQLKD